MAEPLDRLNHQRRAALKKANEVRAVRSRIKNQVKSGQLDVFKLIRGEYHDLEDDILGWRLEQIVMIVPYVGSAGAQAIWESGRFSPRMKLRALAPRRRAELAKLCSEARVRR